MNRARLSTGHELLLDGELLGILETLYKEVTLRLQLRGTYEDMRREIEGLVGQMSEEDRSAMYDLLSEALPVGRVGEVGDIAQTVLYLMRNGYSSGTIVTVGGGSVLV